MMRSPTLSQVKRHHLADTCCHCSAHAAVLGNRWCSQTFRDKQVSFAEPFAGVSVLLGSLVDRIMQFQRCWFSFIFFFFFLNHVLHINRQLAVLSFWQFCEVPPKGTPALPSRSHTNTGKHTHQHTHSFWESMSSHYSCPLHCPLPTSLFASSHLDVVKWVIAARLRWSTSHAEPSIQRVLGGPMQRVVLWEWQHHCISLWIETGWRYPEEAAQDLFYFISWQELKLI